ncbi:hypothetical protein ACQWB2_25670, partial [Salmonella enterica subsp. enterica serovar Infantis]
FAGHVNHAPDGGDDAGYQHNFECSTHVVSLFTAACRPFRNDAAEFLAKAIRYNEGKVKSS